MSRYIDVDKKIEELEYKIDSLTRLIENRPYDEIAKRDIGTYESFLIELKNTPTADVAEIKNMKWRRHYYISSSPMGGKYEDGWICSVCGKHSYLRKEICDGCNTIMWKVEIR